MTNKFLTLIANSNKCQHNGIPLAYFRAQKQSQQATSGKQISRRDKGQTIIAKYILLTYKPLHINNKLIIWIYYKQKSYRKCVIYMQGAWNLIDAQATRLYQNRYCFGVTCRTGKWQLCRNYVLGKYTTSMRTFARWEYRTKK